MFKSVIVATLVSGTVLLASPREAKAQTRISVSPDGKGIAGCALLGAETVALIQGAAGVRARWTYAVFPLLGAIGGGVGGYVLESAARGTGATPDGTLTGVAVATLVAGLGLVIPTTIVYVNATSYHPSEEAESEDNAPTGPIEETTPTGGAPAEGAPSGGGSSAPAAGGGEGGATPAPATTAPAGGTSALPRRAPRALATRAPIAPGLLHLGNGGFQLGVPSISVGNVYSTAETRQYGQSPMTEVRIPVLTGTF
ncbi:MAG: hypothetical protein HY909_18260 [Deltaproteobacteria bacterium]|nr:hypothetical protein [Deltaproteobacteria bacterium]